MTNGNTAVSIYETRLPRPIGYDGAFWQILCEVIYPLVRNPRSIVLAVEYCRARKLDILKRPVNIVPMWNAELRKEVDTIWPSIGETQITAHRSHEYAGIDFPVLGPDKTQTFTGRRKDKDGNYSDANITLTFPEWASVTVYRMKNGVRCAFVGEPVYWLEAYGRSGGTQLPNGTWIKRTRGQLMKVAKAAALRAAFPEDENSPTDEEMEGQTIDVDFDEAGQIAQPQRPPITEVKPAATKDALDEVIPLKDEPRAVEKLPQQEWRVWGEVFIALVRTANTDKLVDDWKDQNKATLEALEREAPRLYSTLLHSINKHKLTLQ